MLAVEHLNLRIGNTVVCQDLSFELSPGKTLVILGGNGVGKSTLLSCLCGHLAPHGKMSGSILWRLPEEIASAAMAGTNDQTRNVDAGQQISAPIQSAHTSAPTMLATAVPTMLANSPKTNGQTLAQMSHKQRARLCGYLAQRSQFLGTVLETVLSGRHPHLLRWQWESSTDFALASAALSLVGLTNYEQRDSQTLSGGEQQRLAIATLLTQAPACLFLDEPLTHLDIYHEFLIMELLCNGQQHGVTESLSSLSAAMTATTLAATKLMVLHQPGLAARYADEVILMFGGGDVIVGPAAELLTAENISRLYDYPMVHVADDAGAWFIPGQTQPYPFKPQRGAMR